MDTKKLINFGLIGLAAVGFILGVVAIFVPFINVGRDGYSMFALSDIVGHNSSFNGLKFMPIAGGVLLLIGCALCIGDLFLMIFLEKNIKILHRTAPYIAFLGAGVLIATAIMFTRADNYNIGAGMILAVVGGGLAFVADIVGMFLNKD